MTACTLQFDVRMRRTRCARGVLAGVMLLVSLWGAAGAWAQVPRVVAHQGVLTDAAGLPAPDGTYSMTFRVYDAPTGGSELYDETQPAVAVAGGRFDVILGTVTPLDLPFDAPYWVGLQVGSDPEFSPRLPLTAAPYALSLALPFRGRTDGPTAAMSITNTSSFAYPVKADPTMVVEGATNSRVIASVVDDPGISGSLVQIEDATGTSPRAGLQYAEIDGYGAGSLMFAARGTVPSGFYAESGVTGLSEPLMQLDGSLGTTYLSPTDVVLPPASLSAGELEAEPGVASVVSGIDIIEIDITPSTVLASVTIDVPSTGLVFLTSSCEVAFDHVNSNLSACEMDIRSTADATMNGVRVGVPASAPTGVYRFGAPMSTTYRVSSPGSHTYYLLAYGCAGPGCGNPVTVEDVHLAALFVPTEYGFNEMFP